jgi:hypothetical protein
MSTDTDADPVGRNACEVCDRPIRRAFRGNVDRCHVCFKEGRKA